MGHGGREGEVKSFGMKCMPNIYVRRKNSYESSKLTYLFAFQHCILKEQKAETTHTNYAVIPSCQKKACLEPAEGFVFWHFE